MTQPLLAFQTELLNKIQFKSSSKVSSDAFLFKAFKFFDLHNNGSLNKNDFFKAIAKCGVVVDTHDMDTVFEHYAAEDGKLYYKNFIQQFLFREDNEKEQPHPLNTSNRQSAPQPSDKPQSRSGLQQATRNKLAESKIDKIYSKCDTYKEVLDHIKRSIQNHGVSSLLSLAVTLKATDKKKSHTINKQTLQSTAPYLNNQHLDLIFSELSQNRTDVDYSVLIYDLKGQLEEQRIKDIEEAFNLLDTRREGEFSINYMLSKFLSKSELQHFQHSVQLYQEFQGIDDGVFTEDDFHDCLGFLSFDYTTNEQFRKRIIRPFYQQDNKSVASHRSNRSRDFPSNKSQVIQEVEPAHLDQGNFKKHKDNTPIGSKAKLEEQHPELTHQELNDKDQKKSVSRYSQHDIKQVPSDQLRDVQSILLRIKKRLASKGTKGFLLFEKAMKNADIDRDSLLNYEQFKQVIKDQRIDITSTETDHIFSIFDEHGANLISYEQFMFTLRGKMPEFRRQLSQKLWNQLKVTQQSSNFGRLKKNVNFRNHPEVQNGRKYEQDLWKQIQQTILTIQQLNGSVRCDTISKAEFQQYLQNLSLSILDDKLYETLLQHFWRLQCNNNIQEKYAGSRKVFGSSKDSYLMDHHRYAVKGGSVSQNAPFGTSQEPTNYLTEHRKL